MARPAPGCLRLPCGAYRAMISFIVPAYNEERLLGATLTSLHTAAQALGERYEIVVADDASTDRTAEIARAHGAVVVACANRQISATRNAGAAAALGDRLVFVDADTRIDAAVLGAALQALRDGAVGGGAPVRFDGVVPWYARLLLPVVVLAFRAARLAAGCFVFCTRSAFVATGGFDTTLYAAEELAMSRSLKRQGRFVILREVVLTSGRKLRTHSARELLGLLLRLAPRGVAGVKQREGLDLWYAARRDDA